jgi:5-methylcytosine-specific restriction protein B
VSEQLQVSWDTFLEWTSLFYSAPEFDSEERDGKLAAVEPLKVCRQHLLGDDTWLPELRNGLTNSHSGGVDFRLADRYLTWAERNQERAGESLAALWAVEAEDGPARVNAFDLLLPVDAASGTGTRLNLASYLLGAIDLSTWPPYRIRVVEDALELTGTQPPSANCSIAKRYAHALAFFDEITEHMATRGTELRDRLDAQGLLWSVVKWSRRPSTFTVEQWAQLKEYRKIPAALRKAALPPPKKVKMPSRPLRGHCTHCNNDETTFVGKEGEAWMFRCDESVQHVDGKPFTFPQSSR